MGFLGDFFGDGEVMDIVAGGEADILDIFGRRGARASREAADEERSALEAAIEEQRRATEQGLGFLDPFAGVGQRGVDLSGFLGDPNAQFDFLQNNPLFQMALDNANQATLAQGAAGGRLLAGDTLLQLSNNVLLSAQPLIDRQRQDIGNLLNVGTGIATTQANTALGQASNVSNLLTDIGNVNAAGIAGGQQASQQGAENALQIAGAIFGLSDSRLKSNAEKIGVENGYDVWRWDWNDEAYDKFGLTGESKGVMFSDVLEKNPKATAYQDGFGKVNYQMIGVNYAS